MAEDEGRAHRIAELKHRHPLLTWAQIAQRVGVTERSAIKWQRTGALNPDNAAALAEVFGVDFDFIWTGPRPNTPELFVDRRQDPKPLGPVAVNELEGELGERVAAMEKALYTVVDTLSDAMGLLREARSEQDRVSALLERQDDILRRIEGSIELADDASTRADDAAGRLNAAVQEAQRVLRAGSPRTAREAPKPAPSRTPKASQRKPR